jgi:hypothetical protein
MKLAMKRVFAIVVLLSLPLSVHLLGQGQSEQKIIFHVTVVRTGDASSDQCPNNDCISTRFTVEGYSDVKGDSRLTEYVLECVQRIPIPVREDSVLVKCPRFHPYSDYEASLGSGPTDEHICSGIGLCYKIVSEKEINKQNRDADPCASKRPLAGSTRPK